MVMRVRQAWIESTHCWHGVSKHRVLVSYYAKESAGLHTAQPAQPRQPSLWFLFLPTHQACLWQQQHGRLGGIYAVKHPAVS
eukprot:1160748-Pelagomonas_calceolata.AAC.8